ncbi:MAG: LPS export ABC transporter protein LptC [Porticoccaceae bacterium]|jgi:LPS export ABC transporter protein LptC
MIRQSFIGTALLIIVGWFLIVWDSPPESFMPGSNTSIVQERQVDGYMASITSQRFSVTGEQLFLLTSPKMQLFEGDSRLELTQPRFLSLPKGPNNKGKGIAFSADFGTLSGAGDLMFLEGNVKAIITGTEQKKTLTAASLEYQLTEMIVSTDKKFTLETAQSFLTGEGLVGDLNKDLFTLKSKVHGVHDAI